MEAEEKLKILQRKVEGHAEKIESTQTVGGAVTEAKVHNLNRTLIEQMTKMKNVLEDTRMEKEEIVGKSEKDCGIQL